MRNKNHYVELDSLITIMFQPWKNFFQLNNPKILSTAVTSPKVDSISLLPVEIAISESMIKVTLFSQRYQKYKHWSRMCRMEL